MRLSQLTWMASNMKSTSLTSRTRKKKSKKTVASRHTGSRLQNLCKPPEWNNTINNHSFGLTREELKRRREQRISKNLTTAQVELYDKMRSGRKRTRNTQRTQSLSPNARLGEEGMNQDPVDVPDLDVLLRRSQDLINVSRELLRPTVPAERYASSTFTKVELKPSSAMRNYTDDTCQGDLNLVHHVSQDTSQVGVDVEGSYLARMFHGLKVGEDRFD